MRHGKLLVAAAVVLLLAGAPPFDHAQDGYAQDRAAQAPPFASAQGKPFDVAQGRPFDVAQGKPFDVAQGKPFDVAQGRPGDWVHAPGYVQLFAPPRAHTGAYQAWVSPLDVGAVLRQLEHDPSLLHPPGAWTPSALLPLEAFGQTGGYERWKVARLYGARRATVARGPRGAGGRPTQAWTLISPYPDRNLERLEPGTLLLILDLNP